MPSILYSIIYFLFYDFPMLLRARCARISYSNYAHKTDDFLMRNFISTNGVVFEFQFLAE